MTEGTINGTLPPVRSWPAAELTGVDFDPAPAELMHKGPVTPFELSQDEGWNWLMTGYDDVRTVANDPRFSREPVAARQSTGFPRPLRAAARRRRVVSRS
ncbi:hypothetical protein BX257_1721 [Streptomyces sp. 3212.3]|uniref:hypothetical protein n=1 Tax=unclassified Streptomyces TaxID=2593676 RepID=UPI000E234788|nr:hypothetical protein BX257_1721 [Streptomyces sp. 3212.3]